jgi:hypothetical protein
MLSFADLDAITIEANIFEASERQGCGKGRSQLDSLLAGQEEGMSLALQTKLIYLMIHLM